MFTFQIVDHEAVQQVNFTMRTRVAVSKVDIHSVTPDVSHSKSFKRNKHMAVKEICTHPLFEQQITSSLT